MSGTQTAYNRGRDDGRAGLLPCNPYRHFTIGDNASKYVEGYASGAREFNAGLTKAGRQNQERKNLVFSLPYGTRWNEPAPYKGGMSKDRVKLELGYKYFTNAAQITVLKQAFGFTDEDIRHANTLLHKGYVTQTEPKVTIICRPSQFARFMVLRNDAGLANGFKELKPKLFDPNAGEYDWDVDVSRNKAW